MGNAVPEPTPVLLGYADHFSVQAGDTIQFMVSCEAPSFAAQLVRLIHGDNNPAGPGYREEPQPSTVDGTYPGQRQTIAAGSYAVISQPSCNNDSTMNMAGDSRMSSVPPLKASPSTARRFPRNVHNALRTLRRKRCR